MTEDGTTGPVGQPGSSEPQGNPQPAVVEPGIPAQPTPAQPAIQPTVVEELVAGMEAEDPDPVLAEEEAEEEDEGEDLDSILALDVAKKDDTAELEPVSLVTTGERLHFTHGASNFYYRRLPTKVRNRLVNKHTRNGDFNWGKFMSDAMKYCLLDWDTVVGGGQTIPFDRRLIDALPQEIQQKVQDLSGAALTQQEERTKN